MTTTRDLRSPLRARVAVAIVTLCGLSALFVITDFVGAGHIIGFDSVPAQAAGCLLDPQGCDSGTIDSGQVNVGRDKIVPGTPGARRPGSGGTIIVVPKPQIDGNNLDFACGLLRPAPWYCPATGTTAPEVNSPVGPLRLRDIKAFVPSNPSLDSQPSGWGIALLPTNFVGGAVTHVKHGILLQESASVRFTPLRYIWQFGDGATVTTTQAGRSWRESGVPDFTPTATSHVYAKAGVVTASVTVVYRAEYSILKSAWRSIAGTISKKATRVLTIQPGGTPLLVARGCLNSAGARGC